MADPLPHWLRPGPAAPPAAVAAALSRALLPPCADAMAPEWLREDQRLSFSRALAAVRRHGGALLADAVGSGKSFIALAVARAFQPDEPVLVLAPAALIPQWRGVGKRVGVELLLHSHELLSRGRLPAAGQSLVVIDESHRFRTPTTRRYETLAPWCVGRQGLLLSATPVVNRMQDLGHQLLLFVRNDALAWTGISRLTGLAGQVSLGALAHLVITGEDRSAALPEATVRDLRPRESASGGFTILRSGIAGLTLSRSPALASLLRGTLLVALASSPLAVAEALGRYLSLLQHARDAAAAGKSLTRNAIRRMVGRESDQLVLWPLLGDGLETSDLALDDLEAVERLERAARAWAAGQDGKLEALRSVLLDEKPTLIFTQATATVTHLRHRLGRRVAWCMGQASGLDATRLPREVVLDWFRLGPDDRSERPKLLLATDVAAEGLDLPLVRRVVHYDLPWTAVRLDQRSGRALRIGSRARSVEVIRLLPPAALEGALRREQILLCKSDLPEQLGLGRGADAPWRTRARLAARWEGVAATLGVAAVRGPVAGAVAGFRIALGDGTEHHIVLARGRAGWSDEISEIFRLLECAAGETAVGPPDHATTRTLLRSLAVQVRAALRTIQGARLLGDSAADPSHRAIRRLLALARDAARRRDHRQLSLLERGLFLLRRGRTAGETRLIAGWHDLPVKALLLNLARLPPADSPAEVVRVELSGILVVEGPPPSR